MCPKGDDPLTVNQEYREISLEVTGTMSGSIGFEFHGETTMIALAGASSQECTAALKTARRFNNIGCEFVYISHNDYIFKITFYSWPTIPAENNIHTHEGNPSISEFFCDRSSASADIICSFKDIISNNIREHVYCANRGICDFTMGKCKCSEGYGGLACTDVTYAITQGSNFVPGMLVNVYGPNYASSALQVVSEKSMAPDFYLMEAIAHSDQLFFVRGDGLVAANQLLITKAGISIQYGGLTVMRGGVTVTDDGVNIYYTQNSGNILSVSSTNPYFSTDAAVYISTVASNRAHYLIKAKNAGITRFSVRSDGLLQVHTGGMWVTGGATIYSGGLRVTGGATIYSGGVVVTTSGLSVAFGGLTVTSGGSIMSGGFTVTGGATIRSGGLTVDINGFRVTAGGATIHAGGLTVDAAGASIYAGGLTVTTGVTIYTAGLKVTGGASINSAGLTATGGITVWNAGISVTGGLSVQLGGLSVTGGATVYNLGLSVTGGLTVEIDGLTVSGGMTVFDSGLTVTGGMSVFNTGLTVTGGLTVEIDGLTVSGGMTVFDAGLTVTGGMS
eukprot:gene11812-24748_t